MKKVTNQELLARIIKLENLTQELEKKIKEMLDSCSCVKESLEERRLKESESYIQSSTELIPKQIMPKPRCSCGGNNYHFCGYNSYSEDK